MSEIKIFNIWHLRRAGGHAIQFWIKDRAKRKFGRSKEINNIQPHSFKRKVEALHNAGYKVILPNYEEHSIKQSSKCIYVEAEITHIIVLRDIINNAASMIKRNLQRARPLDEYYLGYLSSDHKILNYNRWCNNGEYRGKFLESLGLDYDDRSYNYVPIYGKGSSFTGRGPVDHGSLANRHLLVDQEHLADYVIEKFPRSIKASYEYFYDDLSDDMKKFYERVIEKL